MRTFRVFSILALMAVCLIFPVLSHSAGAPTFVISTILDGAKSTFGAVAVAATPAATPTDIFTLYGAAGYQVRVKKVTISGLATTAGSIDVSLVKRTTIDKAGTIVTTGSSMTVTPTNGNYDTFTISGANLTAFTNSSAPTGGETGILTISGLTIGTQYIFTTIPSSTSGQVPTLTATSGFSKLSPIPALVTTVVENVVFTPSATSVVFTLSNTAASHWSTASTTCYATSVQPVGYDSNQPHAAMAFPALYSANPGTLGTGIPLSDKTLNLGLAGAAGVVTFDFMTSNDKPLFLNGATEGLSVYLNGQALPASTGTQISIAAEWEEIP